jgi:bisphosphoglycerate-independent phosphoglycerate mutase (AlkP superfamily)
MDKPTPPSAMRKLLLVNYADARDSAKRGGSPDVAEFGERLDYYVASTVAALADRLAAAEQTARYETDVAQQALATVAALTEERNRLREAVVESVEVADADRRWLAGSGDCSRAARQAIDVRRLYALRGLRNALRPAEAPTDGR